MHIQERDNTAAIVSLLCSDFHCRRGASLRVLHDTALLKWVVGRRTKAKGKEMAAAFILYSAAVEGLRSCSCSTTARCHEHVGSTRPGQRFAFSAALHERYSNTSNSSECSCSHCQYSILHLKQLAAHTCHLCCDRLRKNALLVLRLLTLKLKNRYSIQAADSESMGASAAATASDVLVQHHWHRIHTCWSVPESSEQQHCRVQSQVSLHTTVQLLYSYVQINVSQKHV
jgi:hypothetical protein